MLKARRTENFIYSNWFQSFKPFNRCAPFKSLKPHSLTPNHFHLVPEPARPTAVSGFMRDRRRSLLWVFEAKKRYGLSVLDYTVSSNRIHLPLRDTGANNDPARWVLNDATFWHEARWFRNARRCALCCRSRKRGVGCQRSITVKL